MKIKKTEQILIFTLLFCMLFHFVSFAANCAQIKKDVLRLHILANSDTAVDQALKLQVRDALLRAGYDIFEGAKDVEAAKRQVRNHLAQIETIAREALRNNGCDDAVHASLETCFFDTRYYKSFTLPAGKYEALKIVIGAGEGHNWWCVMFPALCMAASEEQASACLSKDEMDLIESNPKTEIRFKCVEIYEKIINLL